MDWKKIKAGAYRALRTTLTREDQAFAKGADDDLKALATQMCQYWRATLEGDVLTGNLIATALHRARLLCSAVGVTAQGKAQRVEKIIALFADIGVELIQVFDNGGTDGKDQEEQG